MNIYKKGTLGIDAFLSQKIPILHRRMHRHKLGIKYIFSGGTAAMVDFTILYFLTDLMGLWYLYSAVAAYIASFLTAFLLQKFWTFRDFRMDQLGRQLFLYGSISVAGLGINSILMYLLVSVWGLWYILAQFIISGLLAIGSFLINKTFTFKSPF